MDTCRGARRWCYLLLLAISFLLPLHVHAQASSCFTTTTHDNCAAWFTQFPAFYFGGMDGPKCIGVPFNPAASGGNKSITPDCPSEFYLTAGGTCVKDRACTSCEAKSGQEATAAANSSVPVNALPTDFKRPIESCVDGCTAAGKTGFCGILGGKVHCEVPKSFFTGEQCKPAAESVPTPTPQANDSTPTVATPYPDKVPDGKCREYINGRVYYVNCDTTAKSSQSTTTTGGAPTGGAAVPIGADAGVACPAGIGAPNAQGMCTCFLSLSPLQGIPVQCAAPTTATQTSTVTSTQTCTGAGCTSTVKTDSVSNGLTSSNVVSTMTQTGDYCKDNPTLPICKTSNFSGSCAAGFVCEGDSAQCASARGIWDTRCMVEKFNFDVKDTPLNGLGKSASDLIGNPSDHPDKSKTNKSVGTFDTANPFASSCPQDYSFTVLGQQQQIPFSGMCSLLTLMGQLLVGLTMLASAMWLVKG